MPRSLSKILAILALGCIYALPAFAETVPFREGRDYLALPVNPVTLAENPKNKVTLVEFFSYGCPACYHLEPYLEKWLAKKPHYVDFHRVPVEFQPSWIVYARSYYITEAMGIHHKINKPLFDAIQTGKKDLSIPNAIADFIAQQGGSKETFLSLYHHSPSIDAHLAKGRQLVAATTIFQVPTLMIDGKYKVDPSLAGADQKRLFAIVHFLIHREALAKGLVHSAAGGGGVKG